MRWRLLTVWHWLWDTWELWRHPLSYASPEHVDVTDTARQQAIRDAEYNQAADRDSRVQRISQQPTAQARHGHLVRFVRRGSNLSYPTYDVVAQRGDFIMGKIEFRNQWRSYAYYPLADGVYNQQVLAEIYAMLKELKSN